MENQIQLIRNLSQQEPKTMLERFAKLAEETGELAQEILINERASGFNHKTKGVDGIPGEAVDVLIVTLSIFFKNGGSMAELSQLIEKKCAVWERRIN